MHHSKRAFSLVELVVIVVILGIIAAILWPVFQRAERAEKEKHGPSCQDNLKHIMLGLMQYQQDYSGSFPQKYLCTPLMPLRGYGWHDAIQPYVKSVQLFHCPQSLSVVTLKGVSDYWFNARLSGASSGYLSNPAWTLTAGDGEVGCAPTEANYAISSLPQEWLTGTDSPAQRHLGTANYAFADGHVKAYKADAIHNTMAPSQNRPTFRTGEDKPKPPTL